MAADVTLKVDADTSAYIAKVSKMNDVHEKTTGHLSKHVELGDKFTHGLERSLGRAISIHTAFDKITEAIIKTTEKAAEMNRKMGGEVNNLGSSLMQFGFGGEKLDAQMAVVNQEGGRATKSERAALAASLAKAQRDRKEKGLPAITEKQFDETMNLGARGGSLVYGPNLEDLVSPFNDQRQGYGVGMDMRKYGQELARKRGNLPAGTANPLSDLLNALPENLKAEGRMRNREFKSELEKEEIGLGAFGLGARQAVEQRELFDLKHPIAAVLTDNPISKSVDMSLRASANAEAERLRLEQRKVLRQDNPHDEGHK